MKKIFASLILNKATENLIEQAAANQGSEVSTNPEVVSSAVDFQKELDALGARQEAQAEAEGSQGAGDGLDNAQAGTGEDGLGGAGDSNPDGGDLGATGDLSGLEANGGDTPEVQPPAEPEAPAEGAEQPQEPAPEQAPEGEGEQAPAPEVTPEEAAAPAEGQAQATDGESTGEQEQGQAEQTSGDEATQEAGSSDEAEDPEQFVEALERVASLYGRAIKAHQFGAISPAHEALIHMELEAIGRPLGIVPVASLSAENNMSGNNLRETGRKVVEFIRTIMKKFLEWARKAYGAAREFIAGYNKQRADMKRLGTMGALREAIEGKSAAEVDAVLTVKEFSLPFYGPKTYDVQSLVKEHQEVMGCLLEIAKHPHFINFISLASQMTDNIGKLVNAGAGVDMVGQLLTTAFARDVLDIDSLREKIARVNGGRFVQNRGRGTDTVLMVELPGGSELQVSPIQAAGMDPDGIINEIRSVNISTVIGTSEGKLKGVTAASIEEIATAVEKGEAQVAALQSVVAPFGDGAFGDLTKHVEKASDALAAQVMRGTYSQDDSVVLINMMVTLGQMTTPKIFSVLTSLVKLGTMYQTSLQGVISAASVEATKIQSDKA